MAGRIEAAIQKFFQRGMQPGEPLRGDVETVARETIHADLQNPGAQLHTDAQALVQQTVQADLGTPGSAIAGAVDTAARAAAQNEITSQLAPGHVLRATVETIAQGAIPPPTARVDEVLDAMQPGSPRHGDFETAVTALVPAPLPPADPVATVAQAMADPALRGPFDTEIARVADDRIAAAGGTPAPRRMLSRRELVVAGVGAGAAIVFCGGSTLIAKALGFYNGTTTISYTSTVLPSATNAPQPPTESTATPVEQNPQTPYVGQQITTENYPNQTADFTNIQVPSFATMIAQGVNYSDSATGFFVTDGSGAYEAIRSNTTIGNLHIQAGSYQSFDTSIAQAKFWEALRTARNNGWVRNHVRYLSGWTVPADIQNDPGISDIVSV